MKQSGVHADAISVQQKGKENANVLLISPGRLRQYKDGDSSSPQADLLISK
jgi:hypothetical protein